MTFVASPCLICTFSELFEALGEINILSADSSIKLMAGYIVLYSTPAKSASAYLCVRYGIVFQNWKQKREEQYDLRAVGKWKRKPKVLLSTDKWVLFLS
jgi:hypothetical protein